jgi:acyl-CoA dehydrogenase
VERVAFGKPLSENDVTQERNAQARIEIDRARLLVLHAAWMMDTHGNKTAQQAIAEIKVAVPEMTTRVLDWAIQLHGAAGVSQVFPLAYLAATARTMRILDGPDEVHRRHIARIELKKHS